MNWHFCIDSAEKRALKLCYGSMNKGDGYGYGDGYGDGDGFGGPAQSQGDGRKRYGDGFGTGTGDGNLRRRGGIFSGSGTCPDTWF